MASARRVGVRSLSPGVGVEAQPLVGGPDEGGAPPGGAHPSSAAGTIRLVRAKRVADG